MTTSKASWRVEVVTVLSDQDIEDFFELFSLVTNLVNRERLADNLSKIITHDSSALLAVRDSGRVVGCAIANLRFKSGRTEGLLDEVVVSERMRGQGMGKTLTIAVIEWCKKMGAVLVELTSRPSRQNTEAFYYNLGFQVRDTRVYRLTFTEGANVSSATLLPSKEQIV